LTPSLIPPYLIPLSDGGEKYTEKVIRKRMEKREGEGREGELMRMETEERQIMKWMITLQERDER
jgi:hypothetical protein